MSYDLDPEDEHVYAAIDLHQRHLSDEQMAYRCFADEKILQDSSDALWRALRVLGIN